MIQFKLIVATIAGFVLGGAIIHEIQAQGKPPAYVVISIRKINDANGFKAGVVDKTAPAEIAAAGGRYVVRSQGVTALDGTPPERFIVIAFDSVEKAKAWRNSPSQMEVDAARRKTTDSYSILV